MNNLPGNLVVSAPRLKNNAHKDMYHQQQTRILMLRQLSSSSPHKMAYQLTGYSLKKARLFVGGFYQIIFSFICLKVSVIIIPQDTMEMVRRGMRMQIRDLASKTQWELQVCLKMRYLWQRSN